MPILLMLPLILAISDAAAAVWVAVVSTVIAPIAIGFYRNRQQIKQIKETAVTAATKAEAVEQKAEQAIWDAAVVHQDLQGRIGTPNGKGNLVQMMETLIYQQTAVKAMYQALVQRLDTMDKRDDATMVLLTEHLKRYDRDHRPDGPTIMHPGPRDPVPPTPTPWRSVRAENKNRDAEFDVPIT